MSTGTMDAVFAVEMPPPAAFHGVLHVHDVLASSGNPNVKSAALVEGDGGVGSVVRFHFADMGVLEKEIVFLDNEAFEITNIIRTGFYIGTKLKSFSYHVKILPSPPATTGKGGSLFKAHVEYEHLPGSDLKEEQIEAGVARLLEVFKAMETRFKAVTPLIFDEEVAVDGVPPEKMFSALIKYHEVAKKIAPEKVNSAGLIQGDGGVGSIVQLDLVNEGVVKERTELLDKENLEIKVSEIEGPGIGTKLGSVTYHFKVSPAPTGSGSVCKAHTEYITLPGVDVAEVDLNIRKEKAVGIVKAVAAYLVAVA